jgi:leucyl/phenylalanyl-tRNA---protein transferase
MILTLGSQLWFPDPRTAIRSGRNAGLVAVGGDLSPARLLLAYRSGIFPWSIDPISWWSPDPRAVIEFDAFHVPSSLRTVLRKGPFRISMNTAFEQVMRGCAAPRHERDPTWISPEFIRAYTQLHERGHAHSLECWIGSDLVGGIYGVAAGAFFAGESMFHSVSNASKVALCHLVNHLRARGFELIDIQMLTPVTQQLGASLISREAYLERLSRAVQANTCF